MERISMSKLFWRAMLLVPVVLAAACSARVDEPTESSPVRDQSRAESKPVRSFSLTLKERSDSDLKVVTAKLLRIVGQGESNAADKVVLVRREDRVALGAPEIYPSLRAQYERPDLFEVSNVELPRVRDGVLISDEEAEARAGAVLEQLRAEGLVATDESIADAETSQVIQGVGHSDGSAPVRSVKEYRFFLPLKLDGIVVNDGEQQDLGVRIAIHRSGAVQSVRIRGLSVNAQEVGDPVPRVLTSSRLDDVVAADHPGAETVNVGLRYSLGAEAGQPRQVYQISRTSVVDGATVRSRASMVYYSVLTERPPQVWPTPNPDAKSDRPRTTQ
jgi:hypothetical protein